MLRDTQHVLLQCNCMYWDISNLVHVIYWVKERERRMPSKYSLYRGHFLISALFCPIMASFIWAWTLCGHRIICIQMIRAKIALKLNYRHALLHYDNLHWCLPLTIITWQVTIKHRCLNNDIVNYFQMWMLSCGYMEANKCDIKTSEQIRVYVESAVKVK